MTLIEGTLPAGMLQTVSSRSRRYVSLKGQKLIKSARSFLSYHLSSLGSQWIGIYGCHRTFPRSRPLVITTHLPSNFTTVTSIGSGRKEPYLFTLPRKHQWAGHNSRLRLAKRMQEREPQTARPVTA